MPNRNGMVFYEPMWKVNGKGDVKNVACMKNCGNRSEDRFQPARLRQECPGQTAEQNRTIGPVRGLDTSKPAAAK